jgi:hypothetical protein
MGRGREPVDPAVLRRRLRHVYWIGGGSGAGKSTVARRLAARHGLRPFATDDVMADHARRSTPGDSPLLAAFLAMSMDERWALRSPETMLETFHWFRGEGFGLIVEDLLGLPAGPAEPADPGEPAAPAGSAEPAQPAEPAAPGEPVGPAVPAAGVVVEGFRLLPHLVQPLLAGPRHAVWLLPTPAFRRAAFDARGSTWRIAGATGDPERALRNLLARDAMFTDRLREETRRLDLPVVDVDVPMTVDDLTARVTDAFGL